ncbi:MAG: ribosome maturation factor [Bacteroidetes bacterium]|nr:MAG: ribosome maturation factor [Bacteroidota bacterium]
MELTDRIAELLEAKFATEEAFADCFVVDIELKPGNKLLVFTDSDSGMSFGKCQQISRYLEHHLDENRWLGEKYVLEVSSPGIGRPLKFLRQYASNIGRKVAVSLTDGSEETGLLQAADEHQVVLKQQVMEKQGKKKVKLEVDRVIPFDQIDKTVVKVSF